MGSVIVCGFYTEDYRRWLIPLVASLDRLGQAHDFVLAEKTGAMWETNTMAKARHILAAMDQYPDRGNRHDLAGVPVVVAGRKDRATCRENERMLALSGCGNPQTSSDRRILRSFGAGGDMSQPVQSARDVLGLTPEQELVAARIALRMLGGAHGQSPAILLEAIASVLASILEKGELYASDFDEAQRYWDILVCGWVRDRALEIRLERLAREAEAGDRIGTA